MAEPSANGGGENTSAADQKAVKGWLADLARGSRLWIRSTVAAGTVAGIATIIQMVLLARIIHLGIIDEVPVADLTPLFLGLILALVVRALGQGFQNRFAARCSEQVRRDARRQLHKHWQATGPVELGQSSAGTLAREWIDHVEALHGYFARFLPQMTLSMIVPLLSLAMVFWLD